MVTGESKDERMMSLLDSFLEDHKDELPASDRLGEVPADYVAAYLNAPESPESPTGSIIRSKTEQLLDAFLSTDHSKPSFSLSDASGEVAESDRKDDVKQLEDTYFTETLARIYLKQHKYDKALEIIRSLYLNFPNKSIYFADQIRYLEKLVRINQK